MTAAENKRADNSRPKAAGYFGTICPEAEKRKTPPLVLLGGADAHDLILVEILIADCPNTIFVVRNSVESYNYTPTKQ